MSATANVPNRVVPLLEGGSDSLVRAERLRIARELHDVVAHSFAAISLHAGVAEHVKDDHPDQVGEALRAIKAVSGEASRELRAILGVLRRVDDGQPAAVSRGVGGLDALAATASTAGVPTRVAISGRPRPLLAAVDQAAYRIVQESLTNVLRHAGPASASVRVAYEPGRLVVEVVDDGHARKTGDGSSSPGTGHGIAGMRERALALGGRLEAGRRTGGGFQVRASLPFGGAS
jgi:signal transduction histidine kinase